MSEEESKVKKDKYGGLSQKAFEKKMQKFADDTKAQTEKMTNARRKSWDGEPKDIPGASVTEISIKEKKKKGKK